METLYTQTFRNKTTGMPVVAAAVLNPTTGKFITKPVFTNIDNTVFTGLITDLEFPVANSTGSSPATETVTSLILNSDGSATYTNELGQMTRLATNDVSSVEFANVEVITNTCSSNLVIFHTQIQIFMLAVTAEKAPTGDESFNLVDLGPDGLGSTLIYSGKLLAGKKTTGLINVTPYNLAKSNLLQSSILVAAASEKFMLKVFYKELASEFKL